MAPITFDSTPSSIKKAIKEMQKSISLRQIAIQSGVNYITLRNILFKDQDRITSKVNKRIETFYKRFDPKEMKEAAPRRGRKPIAQAVIQKRKSAKTHSVPSPKIVAPKINTKSANNFNKLISADYSGMIKQKKAELDYLMGIQKATQGLRKAVPATL